MRWQYIQRMKGFQLRHNPKNIFLKKAVIEQLESSGNFKCEKGDSLTLEDFESRNRFWSKKAIPHMD